MIGLALLTASAGADWQPLELEKFRAPPAMFFCKGDTSNAGLFTVFLRHNREVSVIEASRAPASGETVKIVDGLHDVVTRDAGSGDIEIKLPIASTEVSAEFVLILGDGSPRGTLAWTAGGETIAGTCTSAPVPPGRTE